MWQCNNHAIRGSNQVNSETRSRVNLQISSEKLGHDPDPWTTISLIQGRGFRSSVKPLKLQTRWICFSLHHQFSFSLSFFCLIFPQFSLVSTKKLCCLKKKEIIRIKPRESWHKFFFFFFSEKDLIPYLSIEEFMPKKHTSPP